MGLEGSTVWAVLAVVVVLFASNRLPPDAIALGGLLALVALGSLSADEALAGFSSPAVIAIASLLVLGAALERSGVVRRIADGLHRVAGKKERNLLVVGTVIPGLLSGFINIVATVSVFIPVLLRLALKAHRPPSHLLLPMAYVAMAGANLTLIGAAANLVVNDILQEHAGESFGMLEFVPVGMAMIAVTTLYALATARWLLPEHETEALNGPEEQTRALIDRYRFSERIWEFEVQADSPAAGMKVGDLRLAEDYGLSLISLVRSDRHRPHLDDASRLEAGDILLMGGRRERVEAVAEAFDGLELHGSPAHHNDFSAGSAELIEVLVPPRSPAIGKTASELDLRSEADLTTIALWRDGEPLRTGAGTTPLQAGDAILLYGNKQYTRGFEPEPNFLWLHPPLKEMAPTRGKRLAPWTVLIFAAAIVIAALDWLPIAVTALAAALGVTLIGALKAEEAYSRVPWRMVILIAAMLPFASALEGSGASKQLADWLIENLAQWGPLSIMGVIAIATILLTQVLHNAAAAAVMAPVALNIALQMDVNPKTFAVAVVVASSMSVLMPVGHPAPLMVRKPGGYKSVDYLRFGIGLAVLTLLVILFVIPWLWPFDAG